jgi:hypothetical protein
VPGLARRTVARERMWILMRASHRLAGATEISLEALRGDRFVVPRADLNAGFNRRLRSLCGFEPACVVASLIWDEAEWPPGDDLVTLVPAAVARHAPPHMRVLALVDEATMPLELLWREDDASPLLGRFLDVATRLPAPARGS